MHRHSLIILCLALLSACSGQAVRDAGMEHVVVAQQRQALHRQSLDATHAQLRQLAAQGDNKYLRYEKAKLLYTVALQEADWESNKQAQQLFEGLLEDKKFILPVYRHAELRAYYGSLYTLKGRDQPGWWWVNNLTPVGLIRIYAVRKGISHLDAAIELDALHPVARLIRANTYINLPEMFASRQQGNDDLLLLYSWLEGERDNSRYQTILQDQTFRLSAYTSIAAAYEQQGDRVMAMRVYTKITHIAPASLEAQLASSIVEQLKAQAREKSL
ncbi:MAG: hypothetical protein OEX03_09465 [Gammaproteobacteria bacterium]|nr:hypothetical protein [Gammaproteobacteria bacterium]